MYLTRRQGKSRMRRSKYDNCPRVRALEAEVARLRRKVEELTAALEEARRAGKRQAAPFIARPPGE